MAEDFEEKIHNHFSCPLTIISNIMKIKLHP